MSVPVQAEDTERIPTDPAELQDRCAKLDRSIAFIEQHYGHPLKLDANKMDMALQAGGIDPDGFSERWGLPYFIFRLALPQPQWLVGYRAEIGCPHH